jgi:hypothetical protein
VAAMFCAAEAGTHVVSGTVRDFDGKPVPGADVAIKSAKFDDLYTAKADAQGHYRMTVEDGHYMALESITMPDYGKTRLEFWAWNVPIDRDLTIDLRFHRLEIYGINIFKVQGARPGLFAYFRPMSLTRAQAKADAHKDPDIAPHEADLDLAIDVDGTPAVIDSIEMVKEFVGPGPVMYSYLVHFSPAKPVKERALVRIVGHDKANGDRGEGLYFYTPFEYR